MTEELLVRCCAPTLASIKTGSLFTCACEAREEVYEKIRAMNCRLTCRGLRIVPLRCKNGKCLVYVYRPRKLCEDLRNENACCILKDYGYTCANAGHCVLKLIERLNENEEFPHEIGLFLGYPPEDVDGFIHHKCDAKCCGYWKVYGDVDAAQKTFARYRKCTDVYLKQWAMGREIERLTVAN